jgi:hydroxymethylpyrimidine/phosphomethylpyrimidine kinase
LEGELKTVLTIAGFDPSSGAGVTADLAVMAAHGLFGTACVTGLTVQSTVGVRATHAVDAGIVAETLACLAEDLPPAGIKIGMLGSEANALAVAGFLQGLAARVGMGGKVPVVLDPVLRSSSGAHLLDMGGLAAMRRELLPLVDFVTPNGGELAALAGMTVDGPAETERAARMLQARWPGLGVVATGGDLERPDDLVAWADGRAEWLLGERIESRSTHGTGCAFSTALLCGLVNGLSAGEALRGAKAYVTGAIRRAEPRGAGHGPMELYWPIRG